MTRKISIIEVLLKKKKYHCLSILEQAWGHQGEELFAGLVGAKMKGRKIVIIARKETPLRRFVEKFIKDHPSRIGNKEIFELESPGRIISHKDLIGYDLFAVLLDITFLFFRVIRSLIVRLTKFDLFYNKFLSHSLTFQVPRIGYKALFNPDEKDTFSLELAKAYKWENYLFDKHSVKLNEEKERIAQEMRINLGIPLDASYVCLHVRDGGFYSNSFYAPKEQYRCADIANYSKAVERLTDRGFWVVRLGDAKMKPASFGNKKFIDYPFSKFKCELLDLYLLEHCQLFVGTDAGPLDVAMLFNRDVVYVNLTDWTMSIPLSYGGLGLIKYFYSKSRQRFLSVKEILEEPYHINFMFSNIRTDSSEYDYIIVENTPQDIETIIEEKMSQGVSYTYSALQNEFVRKRREQYESWIKTNPVIKNNPWECYRAALRLPYKGTLGQDFLRKNFEYGEHLEKMTYDFQQSGLGKIN